MRTSKLFFHAVITMASTAVAIGQTPFMITNVHGNLALQELDVNQISSPKSQTAFVEQATPNGKTNQQWILHRTSGYIYYEIRSVTTGHAISAPASSGSGALLEPEVPTGLPFQDLQIDRAAGSIGYEIMSPATGLVFDVPQLSTAPGTLIQQFTLNGGTNQQWIFHQQALNGILLSASGSGIAITGWGFAAGTKVCPVVLSPATGYITCAPVSSDGSFSYQMNTSRGTDYETFDSSLPGYTVVGIEDTNQNLLALGSTAGSFVPPAQKTGK